MGVRQEHSVFAMVLSDHDHASTIFSTSSSCGTGSDHDCAIRSSGYWNELEPARKRTRLLQVAAPQCLANCIQLIGVVQ